ncbi:MAG: chorismate lyase [Psychromonas sp.]
MTTIITPLLSIATSCHWLAESDPHKCSTLIDSWLFDHNSLTQKLQSKCQKFHVEVKQQLSVTPSEMSLSCYFAAEDKVLVREVLLYCDGVPVVFAQTEIPFSTLTDEQAALAEIGTRSLGDVLFRDPSLKRAEIEVAEFTLGSEMHQLCQQLGQTADFSLWGRRSVFHINNKPLLVSEVFLPASAIYFS